MNDRSHYTFGDSDLAARRLDALAAAYRAPTEAFLRERAPRAPAHAVDLGCGPGHTTALVAETLAPARTTGIDSSERYVEVARHGARPGVEFLVHDLTSPPFPIAGAELVFQRFLLTHLGDPLRVVSDWRALLARGGRLLLQEVSLLEAAHPALARYYELVGALQAHYGQALYIGRDLPQFVAPAEWTVESFTERLIEQPAPVMAELHALNLPTWRRDSFASEHFEARELDELERALGAIARGEARAAPVRAGLGELVLVAR